MAVENQEDSMYAGNRHVLRWNGILDDNGALINLTGRVVKFALTRMDAAGNPIVSSPVIDFASDDVGSQIMITNPVTGNPHVDVELLAADTASLAPAAPVIFYGELEVFDVGEINPVVVATVLLTIKPNVVNA